MIIKAWVVSLRDQFLWQRRVRIPLLLAAAGVLVGGVTLIPWVPSVALLLVSLLGLLLGLVTLVQEWVNLQQRFRDSKLIERSPIFAGQPPFDSDLPDSFATTRGTILYSGALNLQMLGGRTWQADMRPTHYRLPSELAEIAPYILRRTSGGGYLFNGECIRMLGDCRVDGSGIIPFQSTGFFDHLCSNELMRWEVPGRHGRPWDVRSDFLYDEDRRLIPLASSELANVVGVSTLAISQDGFALVVGQSHENHASQGLLAPSGSGSLEPKDFDDDLQTFALNGATREFLEETGVPADLIAGSRLIGYGRWLERGAKPEFFGITLLREDAEQIDRKRRRVGGEEALYTQRSQWLSVADLLDEAGELRSTMSMPLVFSLLALAKALEQDPDLLSPTIHMDRGPDDRGT